MNKELGTDNNQTNKKKVYQIPTLTMMGKMIEETRGTASSANYDDSNNSGMNYTGSQWGK